MENNVLGANLLRRVIVGGGSPFATQAAFDDFRPICLWKNQDSSPVTTLHKRHVPSLNFAKFS
jgi:hypothetical protein